MTVPGVGVIVSLAYSAVIDDPKRFKHCVVFKKVNTGGKALDAFELATSMYAADGHELRRDWYGKKGELGRQHRFIEKLRPADEDAGIIAEVSNTDFLHAVSLFYT